jgi:hypothetical protein
VLLDGHKEPAFEVPFDSCERWGRPAIQLRPGRRGHRVRATLQGVIFEGLVVGRSGRFWLLVPAEVQQVTGIAPGDEAELVLEAAR